MLPILNNMNSLLSDFSNVQESKMNDRGLVSFLLILLGKLIKEILKIPMNETQRIFFMPYMSTFHIKLIAKEKCKPNKTWLNI